MENNEAAGVRAEPERKKGYSWLVRLIALVLVAVLLISATSIDFSVLRYAGSDSMDAASYLLEHTNFLTENRYQRLVSLLTNFSAYEISRQAADSAIGKSDYEKAAKYLNKCIAMDDSVDERAGLCMRLGCVYMLDEKLDEAAGAFDRTIELDPDMAEAYLLRAQVRVSAGDTAGADADCREYIERGGDDKEMLVTAAAVAEYAGDIDTALKSQRRLLELALNDYDRAGHMAEIGRLLYLQGTEAEAAAQIEKALELDQGALSAIHLAIVALHEMNSEQYALACAHFRTAATRADSVDDKASYYEQAMVCAYILMDSELLLLISDEADAAGAMTAQSLMLRGVVAFSQGDYDKSEDSLTRCLEIDADMADAHYYRGLCRMQRKDCGSAAEDFTWSIDNDENTVDSYYNRALCYILLEQYEQAAADLAYVAEHGVNPDLMREANALLETMK